MLTVPQRRYYKCTFLKCTFLKIASAVALLLMLIGATNKLYAQSLTINIPDSSDSQAQYVLGLMELAISKQSTPVKLERVKGDFFVSVPRLIESAKLGEVDIIWSATNKDIENQLLALRVPLYMGMFGYRVLIINRDNRTLFDKVHTLADAKQFKYGQGRGWSDTDILMANGLDVVQSTKWASLFHMTDGGRFHAFPRGVHEPWGELNQFSDLDLAVDQNLLLVYRMPFYLFVNPQKPEVAKLLLEGLNRAVEDGSYVNYFMESETVQSVIANAGFGQRRMITLQNPELPEQTPVNRKELWLESLSIFNKNNVTQIQD